MMNNDDLHLSKISQQFDYSMQNINNPLSQNDDNCMELLDKITFDDNTSNFIPSSTNSNIYVQNNAEVKDDDKYCQEIMSALEKKDFSRILSLAISQSQSGHKMACLLNETIQEIEKSSNKQVDPKIIEKLHSLLRSQPKAIATTPLRATVAPIRNESIVCSSSSNMSNNVGFRPNKAVKSEALQDDFMSLISSDCKLPSGTRSLPATPPISQVPNRPLSSHCVPIRSNEQRKQRSDCDIEQQQQQQQHQMPFCSYGNQQQQQQLQQPMQYLPLNMSQFAPYPQLAPNIVIMPMMNSPADQQGTVTHSLPQSSPVQSQAGQSGSQNNQISLLLSSAAFFSMANTTANQTVTTSHDSGNGAGLSGLSGLGNCTSTTPAVRSPALMPSHGSNLPKLLPKPQQPMIMPRTMQFPAAMQHHHPVQQQQQIQHQNLQQQHHQQQQQQFKRPTNRKTAVKSRSSSRSSKSAAAATAKKDSNKDNVAVAWEIAEQSGVGEEAQASFVTDLTSGTGASTCADEFCLLPPGSDALGALFCSGGGGDSQQTHEFDELLEELVTMSWDVVRNAHIEVQETIFESCLARVEPVRYHRASMVIGGSVVAGAVASQRPMVASHSVVMVRQLPLADLSMSAAAAAVRSSVDSQRVMQLICAHLGRHSATLLSPLLKCLLPTGGTVTNDTGGPLSVCTRLSEQDELTEDDLLADISPVKRDPAQLANLDRFLESCQSITPCSSLQDYEEEPQLMLSSSLFAGGNDMEDDMIEQQHIHHHHPHHNHHSSNKMLLPFQARCQEEHLTLQDFCGDRPTSWLRKSKQRSKWTLNGTVVRCSKALEVPPQLSIGGTTGISATGQMGDHRRDRQLLLRKKSTFKQLGKRPLRKKTVDCARKALKFVATTSVVTKSQRGQEMPNAATTPVAMDTQVIQQEHQEEEIEDANIATSGCLKVRIRLSQLRVVASTIVRSPEPPLPPPPLVVNTSSGGASSSSSSRRRGCTIATGLTTKRIFCTRKEDRRSSALNVGTSTSGGAGGTSGSSASPNKQHRKQHSQPQPQLQQHHSPCKSKRGKKVEQQQPQPLQQLQQQQTVTPVLPSPPQVQQAPAQHPPLILKLSTVKRAPVEPTPQSVTSSGNLKLRLKRSQDCAYSQQQQQMAPQKECNEIVANNNCNNGHSYEFNPTVTLAPPPVHHRPRMQLAAALQFSPAHSSSDSDVDGAHNEISSLLQRQEAAAAAVIAAGGGGAAGGGSGGCNGGPATAADSHHQHHSASAAAAAAAANNSFPQLIPVPYLVGSDPTVFIDPHECDLVVVKNSRYKKVSQRGGGGTGDHHSMAGTVGAGTAITGTEMMDGGQPLSLQTDGTTATGLALSATDGANANNSNNNSGGGLNNGNELLFVPGCFIEQQHDKGSHHLPTTWSHSSPSMPVLAPQEPFTGGGGGSGGGVAEVGKSSHLAVAYEYGNQSQLGQPSQSYIEASSERLQQSPLCMTANAVSQHNSSNSNNNNSNNKHSNSNNHHHSDMRQQDRPTKSPYQQQHPLYYQQQQSYSGPCYLTDNSAVASSSTADQSRSSKSQSYSSPVAANLQTSSCSSHIQDYSLYFQNASQIQSLASTDTAASFSSISLSSSLYPPPVPSADQHQQQQHHHQSHQHQQQQQQHHHQSHQHQHHSQQQQHNQSSSSSSSKHAHSKRPSSSRSHASEHGQQQQSSGSSVVAPKKRKEPSQPPPPSGSLQLPSYAHNSAAAAAAADLYSSAAAAQYPNFDYYSGGFSEIMSNLDRAKIYEQWTRECSSQLGQLCTGTVPWMAEYCKQAATLMPSGVSASNALSLTAANLHGGGGTGAGGGGGTDYSTDLSHSSVDSLKPPPPSSLSYFDPYAAYAMAQPYMYSAFGMPK